MTGSIALRVEAFRSVQNLEYRFDLEDRARDQSCRGKAGKLVHALTGLNLAAAQICCRFRWVDTGLPQELVVRFPHRESQHWFVRMKVPETGREIDIDPTWDPALRQAGFPVAEWDGLNPTLLAVKPFAIFSPEDSARIWNAEDSLPEQTYECFHQLFGGIYDDLNQWVASRRHPLKGFHA
jgi:hypothetical protein